MPFYKWDESLTTGIEDIDVQHQMLFVIINNFIEDRLRGKGKDAVKPVIDFLADYTVKHFAMEEKYMTTYSYPDYAFHKSQHVGFQQDFASLKSQFERDGATSDFTEALKQRVGDWFKNHIMEVDKKLAGFLKTKIYHDHTKTFKNDNYIENNK